MALDRAREGPRKMKRKNEEEIREEGETRLSRARPTSGMHDFEESEAEGGGIEERGAWEGFEVGVQ